MPQANDIVLAVSGIIKNYGATCALRGANLQLRVGQIHALLGENGAGKSTLVKIIVGAVRPDSGTISLAGKVLAFHSVAQAIAEGIVPIYQHLSLFPELSVHENLSAFALAAACSPLVRSALVPRHEAERWLAQVGLAVDLDTSVSSLSLGERQLLEIARGLGQNCRVLVLDEPTAALNREEAERLFAVVRRLCASGTAVLFISHKFDEIEALAHEVTALRDGRSVIDAAPVGVHSRQDLVRAMLGTSVDPGAQRVAARGVPVLRATGLRIGSGRSANLVVHAGEIVGLAGLVGSGVTALAAVLAGALPAGGSITVDGHVLPVGDRAAAVRLGVGYVPGDRHAEGLFLPLTAMWNASSGSLRRFSRGGFIQRRREIATMSPLLRRLNLQPFAVEAEAGTFSGGNQQKLLIARCLSLPDMKVLVLLEPTRGVDVAARTIIHDAIAEAASKGVAVVLASTDLDELMELSDRYLVVRDGEVAAELPRATEQAELLAVLSARAAA